jgi:3'-phosphoadenosine 5'-phosphosulfate (PAPS) 3'-phosphatase
MKIFGIGLSKTGTSSLAQALDILGYRTRDYPGVAHYVRGDLSTLEPAMLDSHDALTDTPIPSLYPALDAHYPGAKFILTVRQMEGWLKSCKKQFTDKHAAALSSAHHQLFSDIYGCTVFDETLFRQGYARFVGEVERYFRDRPDDLLVIDVTAGEGWEKLCPFLGKPIPDLPFPKANVTQIRWMKIQDVIAIAREAGALLPGAHAATPSLSAAVRTRALLRRAFGALRGGRAGAMRAARRSAIHHITRRLQALNAAIPVFSPIAAAPAAQGRLNHFWLVNPLDGDLSGTPDPTRAISIALIEDRKPIYGVVYLPATETVYYAVQGKGAYRARGDDEPVPLARHETPPAASATVVPMPGSTAYSLCRYAEGHFDSLPRLRDAHPCDIAAADAILRAVGRRLQGCGTPSPLPYSQTDARHDCIEIG